MNPPRSLPKILGLALAPLMLLAGCGEPGPRFYPLEGTVLFRGKPLTGAELAFHPVFDGPGWVPVAVSGDHGAFAAGSKWPGDGVLLGRYKVTVIWRPRVNEDGEGPNLLPPRYARADTTDLEIEATADGSRPITLDLH